MRSAWLCAISPIACLPIAHWYVLRGDWLWCGYLRGDSEHATHDEAHV